MTCTACDRVRRRIAEELAKLKAAIALPRHGPTLEEQVQQRRARIARRTQGQGGRSHEHTD